MSNETGVLMYAGGNAMFARMAVNTAISIRANSETPVALLYEESSNIPLYLSYVEQQNHGLLERLFTVREPIPTDRLVIDGVKQWGWLKVNAFDLSPYERTVFLDVDSLLFRGRSVAPVFDRLDAGAHVVFQIDAFDEVARTQRYLVWCNMEELLRGADRSDLRRLPRLHSFIFAFDRHRVARDFFAAAKSVAEDLLTGRSSLVFDRWGRDWVPDELVFLLAALRRDQQQIFESMELFAPLFDPYGRAFERSDDDAVRSKHIGFTLPGHLYRASAIRFYENVHAENCEALGIRPADDLSFEMAPIDLTSMLNGVLVDYHGTPTPLVQVADITLLESSLLVATPWDKAMVDPIETAIRNAELGLTPSNDGRIVRIPVR